MKKQLLLLVVMLLPLVASAYDIEVKNADGVTIYYNYINNNTELEVTFSASYHSSSFREYLGNVVIPEEVTYMDRTYKVTSIGLYAFRECTGLTSVTIPNSVTIIYGLAFGDCTGLTSVTIGNNVMIIADNAFAGCSSLTSITIPSSVTSIGEGAFCNCSALVLISIGSGVTSIESRAFAGCSALASIKVDSANIIYDSRDNCNAIIEKATNTLVVGCKNTFIPNSVTSIGSSAFSGCSGLTSISIHDGVTSIGNNAFYKCSGLTSVTIPNSVTSIGGSVFSGCSSLTSVTIPNSVTVIGNEAFRNCSGLTSISIPNSVTSIGNCAFDGANISTIISLQENPFGISGSSSNNRIFSQNTFNNATLYVPENTIDKYKATVGWKDFNHIEEHRVGEGTIYDVGINDIYYNLMIKGNIAEVTSVPNTYSGILSLPENVTYNNVNYSVTSIGSSAFSGCLGLTSVTIPNSVTSIGSSAFSNCSDLASVTIPNSVARIGNKAFYGCSSLTSFAIPNSVTRIGANTFEGCSRLTSIAIPNSVTVIGNEAFWGCSGLTSINIPNSVTDIGIRAFYSSRLENVLTFNSMTTFDKGTFSDRTLQHAMLYVPEGTWGEAVYDGSWYLFNNIREIAMNQKNLSPEKAYTLMDTKSFGYAVFDGSSDEVKMAKAFYSMDENDLNNCWQVIDKSGAKYLYNIGAKKYAKIASDGKIILTNNETPVNITEGENGLKFGSDTSREWGFVKNNNVTIDNQTGINPVSRTSSELSSTYFSLDGQQTTQPKKGLNIVRMSDGTTKKFVMK